MASINTSINGIDIAVTKLPDGQVVFSSENWPGATFGANNEPVTGHAGGLLSASNISQSLSSDQFRLDTAQKFISDSQSMINDPGVDAAYKETLKTQIAQAQSNIQTISESISAWTALQGQVDSLTQQVQTADAAGAPNGEAATNAQTNAADAQTVNNENANTPSASGGTESPTNPDKTAEETKAAYADPSKVPFDEFAGLDEAIAKQQALNTSETSDSISNVVSRLGGLPDGANNSPPASAQVKWKEATDMRVILRVPSMYMQGPTAILKKIGGIIFPYTPTISYDNTANYSAQQPMHSNYPLYFYQKSGVGSITITGKFTNQNETDGAMYLATIHLLRALTKMLWGADPGAGAPPPVCRLDAYGDFMLNNVPVAITSFKIDLPDSVDYIAVGLKNTTFGHSMVPTVSTLSITLNTMYSRQELLDFSVSKWLSGGLKNRGYL